MLSAPCLWFAYPGPHFRYLSTGKSPWGHRFLSFRGSLANQWIQQGLVFGDFYEFAPETLRWVEQALDSIIEEHEKIERFSEAISQNLLESFLLKLARLRSQSEESASLRNHLLQYLKEENYHPNGYSSLADSLGMSESTLRRRFKQEVGIPIHQFSERERVRQCKILLRTTDDSLEEIAMKLQYPDVYYFFRHFTKLTGLRPGAYRRAELIG